MILKITWAGIVNLICKNMCSLLLLFFSTGALAVAPWEYVIYDGGIAALAGLSCHVHSYDFLFHEDGAQENSASHTPICLRTQMSGAFILEISAGLLPPSAKSADVELRICQKRESGTRLIYQPHLTLS